MAKRDLQGQIQRARRRQVRRALWTVLRERLLLVLGVSVAVLLLTATLGYNYVHAQVYDDVCRPVVEVDLSLSEMAAMNTRLQNYQLDPGRDAHVSLSSDEASFMLAQFVEFGEVLRVENGLVLVEASVPTGNQCVALRALGTLVVQSRVVTFTPLELRLGDLDVTGLGLPTGDVVIEVQDIEGDYPRLAAQLANMESLVVDGDRLDIRLIDRYKLF